MKQKRNISGKPSRWHSFIQAALAQGVKERTVVWYVRVVEAFLRHCARNGANFSSEAVVSDYLRMLGKQAKLEGWRY